MQMQQLSPGEVEIWLKSLNLESDNHISCPDFLKPFHLSTLALSVKKAAWENFTLPPELEAYAIRMHLWNALGLTPPRVINEYEEAGKFLPIHVLYNRDDENDISTIVDELMNILARQVQPNQEDRDALDGCLREIVGNFHDHAQASLPCMICAQSWPKGNLLQISIADAGAGIRATLSKNSELLPRLSQTNACELASEYGVSSRPNDSHTGYGLTLARDLMSDCGGSYLLVSGDELYCYHNGKNISNKVKYKWEGTLLVLEWPMNRHLNSKKVYDGWPTAEGYSDDDFF